MENKRDSYLNLSIAGFNLHISPLDAIETENGIKAFAPFISDAIPKICIKVITDGPIQKNPFYTKVFSSGSHWQLYRDKENYYYEIITQEKGRDFISHLAIFPPDFSSGIIHTYSPVGDLDFPFSYPLNEIFFIHLAALNKGIFIHSCGMKLEKYGLLFVGMSGAGKSTMAQLFARETSALILSDDRIIARKEKDEFRIYGTPWHGTFPDVSNQSAKLKKLFFLKKSPVNQIRRLSPAETNRRLITSSFLPFWDKDFMVKSLLTISEIARQNISFELSFKPDKEVIDLIANC